MRMVSLDLHILRFFVNPLNPESPLLLPECQHHGGGGVDAGGYVVGFFVEVAAGLDDESSVVSAGHVDEGFVVLESLAVLDGVAHVHDRPLVSRAGIHAVELAERVFRKRLTVHTGDLVVDAELVIGGGAGEGVFHDEGGFFENRTRAGGAEVHEEAGALLVGIGDGGRVSDERQRKGESERGGVKWGGRHGV